MPRHPNNLVDGYISHINYLETTRLKMERLLRLRTIVRRDIEQVYEGLYLDSITTFEALLEDLFIGYLVGRIRKSSNRIHFRTTFKSDIIARDIIFGGKNYVDWLPYENTIKRSQLFYRNGLPFTLIDENDKKQLNEIVIIRNAIAHSSLHSRKKFNKQVIGNLALMPREKHPAGFLRSVYRITPMQTRYQYYVTVLSSIAMKLIS